MIKIVSYDEQWPLLFSKEAESLKNILQENVIDLHHVGSTSVPDLASKPKIDVIVVVKKPENAIASLKNSQYTYRGEWNVPFKFGFTKRSGYPINLHIYEEGHSEIEVNLIFRDHLKNNMQSKAEYEALKLKLATDPTSAQKEDHHFFSTYTLGKDSFIRNVLKQENYDGKRFLKTTHHFEWNEYHRIRKELIFDASGLKYDPHHSSLTDPNHHHFILYHGVQIVTALHVEFLNSTTAALRILATDKAFQNKGYASFSMRLMEKWIKSQEIKTIKLHAEPRERPFYEKLGYCDVDFDDVCIVKDYINLGKTL
ncbi:MAG: GNAT family N-acetyltransferase [Candidatus Puniceispirillum sp.]|nr:GNAT family N-acetyltransferase [Candidatus Pelagibacter sp.]MBA4283106.1 GNAT family N-acetyltransferase [Candidatus Puniceispirillum sp.]